MSAMTSRRARLTLAIPTAVAAFLLAIGGALTPANAADTYWQYVNGRSGTCLRAGINGDPVVGTCSDVYSYWYWGTDTNTWNGHTMRRLVNAVSGDCLTSDYATGGDSVLMEPCSADRSGQFWTADDGHIQNQNHLYMGTFPTGTGVYMAFDGSGSTFAWSGRVA
ncbi:hypothetical protein ACIQVK_41990 [Streptomyces sp. NPDC090493]|uniref:hypothetical protein n=1 Tax=Streptomyces sp. NPDC090493 TaxID=3365964 RepID=UPI00381631F2